VRNARDAMPSGGAIRVDVSAGSNPESDLKGDYIRLAVADSGVGMDWETQSRMFEPFFTTKPSGKGTGLGMATVYGLVKQHGGVIEVDTALGRGTRIRIYLPAVRPSTPAAALGAVSGGEVSGGHETILVAEDESDLRRAAKRSLEQAGYQVLTAVDGQEALDVLRQQPRAVHMVLSDLVMPRLGGRGLYDAARREGITTPFLFASGYSPGDERGSPPAEGVPMLHKPWTHDDLLARIRETLDRK